MTKHKIMSLSVEENDYSTYETARQQQGLERSEFWRKAMDHYLGELAKAEPLKGRARGALFIVHDEEKDDVLHELKHSHLVTTQLHTHFSKSEECLEVLIVDGPGRRIDKILKQLQRSRSVRYVQFVRT